jgi:hypothetical protein
MCIIILIFKAKREVKAKSIFMRPSVNVTNSIKRLLQEAIRTQMVQ